MKLLLILLVMTVGLSANIHLCKHYQKKITWAESYFSGSDTSAFYTKWATIGTFYAVRYAECMEQVRHKELLDIQIKPPFIPTQKEYEEVLENEPKDPYSTGY